MRSMPAGMEMNERTSGTHRPRSTAVPPQRWKNASALSKSAWSSSGIRPTRRRVRFRPSAAPIAYQMSAPTSAPIVAAAHAPHALIRPS